MLALVRRRAGTIVFLDLEAGEVPLPGVPSIRLADTGPWRIETADLPNSTSCTSTKADGASVRCAALPDVDLRGTLAHIRHYGELHQGDIVYRAVIVLGPHTEALRWNMTATVTIEPKN